MKGDDGFGPAFIQNIEGRVRALCLDAGSAPENHVGKIVRSRPDTIVLVDAVHLGLAPGEYAVLGKEEILRSGFSTHDLSPRLLIDFIESQTAAKIYLLSVQPESLAMGEALSEPVRKTLDELSRQIQEALHA